MQLQIHHYHHYPSDGTPSWARELNHKLSLVLENQGKIMTSFDDLKTTLDKIQADVGTVQGGVTNLQTQITTLTNELANVQLSPTAQAALDAANQEATNIQTAMDALAGALPPPTNQAGPTT